jgi:SAM-dependent methyltransferase
MPEKFYRAYWEAHWQAEGREVGQDRTPNPYLVSETSDLAPGTALDAGCGEGAEAVWLASAGWQVTAVDISAEVLARAAELASAGGLARSSVRWLQADLSRWEPAAPFDLVTTHYAHPSMPQLAFYDRIAEWVAPGGTLLIVAHLRRPGGTEAGEGHHHEHAEGQHGDGAAPPEEATVTAASITARLDAATWDFVTAEERTRDLTDRVGRATQLHDAIVRATRRR